MKPGATLVALAVGLALSLEAPAQTAYEAELLGSDTDGPGQADGGAAASLVVDGQRVTLTVSREDETGPAVPLAIGFQRPLGPLAAHVHEGVAGAAGRIVVEFPWTSSWGGPSVTTTALAPEGSAERLASNPQGYYVDIHTPSQPAGAARGQIRVSAPRPRRVERFPLPRGGTTSRERQHLGSPGLVGPQPLAAPIVHQELEIARAEQSISARVFDDPPWGPDDLRFEPRASSGLPVSVSTEGMCPFTGSSLRVPGAGSCVVRVDQPGNADFNAAPTLNQAFEVAGEPPPY